MNWKHRQSCECGNETYHIQALLTSRGIGLLASCAECGRITGSVGKGSDYRGEKIEDVEYEQ